MMEKYTNFKKKKLICFVNVETDPRLWYKRVKGLGARNSGPNLSSIPPKTKPNKVPYRTPKPVM
jgi:hypothetical protein